MTDKDAVADTSPREPTRQQRRDIMDLLADVYDVSAERYRQGDTDETVADVLGVMPGWVAQLREDFFGPSGANHDMQALADEVAAAIAADQKALKQIDQMAALVRARTETLKTLQSRLQGIEAAVGPRKMRLVK